LSGKGLLSDFRKAASPAHLPQDLPLEEKHSGVLLHLSDCCWSSQPSWAHWSP